ncbi:MAG: sulfurtransferase-like selenium metabolism protein YedF [Desulfobacteraceae bacterium]|nr:sulfurtransferase-like selenium metabolism protein YedF [Desulfobacteraceae bacterium]
MALKLDCRNIDCPGPVLKTKQAIEEQGATEVKVIVDNDAAVENVTRFLNYHEFEVSVESDGITSTIEGKSTGKIIKQDLPYKEKKADISHDNQKIMVMVGASVLGRGDDELGGKLMINFLKTLKEMGDDLWRLIFVNNGVKLTINDSNTLSILKDLENNNVHILVCGACLTHFDLMNEKAVGETTNMLDIVTSMQLADKVINL